MKFQLNDGAEMYYEYERVKKNKRSKTILFIHGIGLTLQTYNLIVPFLISDYNVLRVDLRGHGLTETGKQEPNIETFCKDITELLINLDIKEVIVVGHGFGGSIALKLATVYQEIIKSVIVISCHALPPFLFSDKILQMKHFPITDNASLSYEEMIRRITKEDLDSEVGQILLKAYSKVDLHTYYQLLKLTAFSKVNIDEYEKIEVPVLNLVGELDGSFPSYSYSILNYFIKNSQFLVVPNSSNCTFLDQPQITAEWIKNWIEQGNTSKNDSWDIYNDHISWMRGNLKKIIEEGYKRVE